MMVYDFGTGLGVSGVLRARRPPPYRSDASGRAVDTALGARLREARRLAGTTRQQLAEALGVTAGTVARYETGARRMSPMRLAAAVRFLGMPISWFFREDGPPRQS
jgi:DNA-binding XRE family transcriptional regulator